MSELFKDLFVFEMANNHQGDVEHGLKIIRAMGRIARRHRINAGVKFQYRDLDSLIHPDYKKREDVKHIPRFLSTRLTKNEFLSLVTAVRDEGMVAICTPFDEASVGTILDHGIQIIKIASCSAMDWPLLETISKARKPVICSTGGLSVYDIDKIVSFFIHRETDFALLHCVGLYPTPNSEAKLNFMERMKKRYPYLTIGYSGHESPDNQEVVKIAVAKGASILERHVGVAADGKRLNSYSMNPEQAEAWVESALRAKEICGDPKGAKKVAQEEMDSLMSLKRGVYASKGIKKGGLLKRRDVFFAMPCGEGQTSSGEYQDTMVASRNYKRNEPISERRQPTIIGNIRSIIHDVKGMLYEANIEFGKEFEIELSHHYGIEHFRQTGAVIVNIINREYCKKLVVLLPGQRHPRHLHKLKEETFQLLWGDLDIVLDGGGLQKLRPGDKVLVERSVWHEFGSRDGAIFEEVSTTHIKGDSYYEDERISSKDPLERKSVLDFW